MEWRVWCFGWGLAWARLGDSEGWMRRGGGDVPIGFSLLEAHGGIAGVQPLYGR
jgi:hypothetical protein